MPVTEEIKPILREIGAICGAGGADVLLDLVNRNSTEQVWRTVLMTLRTRPPSTSAIGYVRKVFESAVVEVAKIEGLCAPRGGSADAPPVWSERIRLARHERRLREAPTAQHADQRAWEQSDFHRAEQAYCAHFGPAGTPIPAQSRSAWQDRRRELAREYELAKGDLVRWGRWPLAGSEAKEE